MSTAGGQKIASAIRAADGPALCAYLMAGYPSIEAFPEILVEVSEVADIVEVGVPFSDPIADGRIIQEAGSVALRNGVSLSWIVETLQNVAPKLRAPHLLMGYYNPFLAYGLNQLTTDLVSVGTAGLIVPDLSLEESGPLHDVAADAGLGLVRLTTPATPSKRLADLGRLSDGFLYAVTTTGITGGDVEIPPELRSYLDQAKASTDVPLMAGFGIRTRAQVAQLAPHVDGVIVGTALIETLSQGEDAASWLARLRP